MQTRLGVLLLYHTCSIVLHPGDLHDIAPSVVLNVDVGPSVAGRPGQAKGRGGAHDTPTLRPGGPILFGSVLLARAGAGAAVCQKPGLYSPIPCSGSAKPA